MSAAVGTSFEWLAEVGLAALLRAVSWRIGNPAVKLGLLPAGSADTKLDLLRKCAFVHFAINGRTGQAGAVEDGLKADDAVWFGHGLCSIG